MRGCEWDRCSCFIEYEIWSSKFFEPEASGVARLSELSVRGHNDENADHPARCISVIVGLSVAYPFDLSNSGVHVDESTLDQLIW